jgi:hypothetical protein
MWTAQGPNLKNKFYCENSKTGDVASGVIFDTLAEAQDWAEKTNAKYRQQAEEGKKASAERKARRDANGQLADKFFIDNNAH